MVYSITYDLKKPGKNYDDLYDAIKKLGSWSHYLDSTWLVSTHHSATEINDKLKTIIDKNDSLFISEVTKITLAG